MWENCPRTCDVPIGADAWDACLTKLAILWVWVEYREAPYQAQSPQLAVDMDKGLSAEAPI